MMNLKLDTAVIEEREIFANTLHPTKEKKYKIFKTRCETVKNYYKPTSEHNTCFACSNEHFKSDYSFRNKNITNMED